MGDQAQLAHDIHTLGPYPLFPRRRYQGRASPGPQRAVQEGKSRSCGMTIKMKPKIYRQGDVLIERIAEIPRGATKRIGIGGRIILAEGEVTGHHHSLDIDDADWWKADGELFLTVNRPTPVTHQEHSPLPLPRGKYRVRRQREYVPKELPRQVAD